ncbi:hypothetical protein ABTM52_19240, partial [Acinetobacter baumannii]
EASFLISKSQETKISFYQKLQLYIHLRICDACLLFKKQTEFIKKMLLAKKRQESIQLSDMKKEEIKQELLKITNEL